MENRKRLTNILTAATLTVFLLTIFFAFRGQSASSDETVAAAAAKTTTIVDPVLPVITTDTTSADLAVLQEQVTALQTQNTELRALLSTMQEREAEYQAQIEAANATIEQLSSQASALSFSGAGETAGFVRPGHSHEHNH